MRNTLTMAAILQRGSDPKLYFNSSRYIQDKNTWLQSAVVPFACEVMLLFAVVFCALNVKGLIANSVTLKPTWTTLELNPDPSCERSVNNRLSSDAAYSLG
jgi:hypothetical protein